jgi:predicted permease
MPNDINNSQKIPIIGDHYVKEIPPSDNVRQTSTLLVLRLVAFFPLGRSFLFTRVLKSRICVLTLSAGFPRGASGYQSAEANSHNSIFATSGAMLTTFTAILAF